MYSAKLLEHFERPRNVGEIADADASVRLENPACGDIMLLTLKLAGGHIADARFRTRGCVAAIGCGSALTEMVVGLSPAQAAGIARETVVEAVGGLPPESTHASHLAIDALRAALKKLAEPH